MKTVVSFSELLSHKIITYAITLIFYPLNSLYVFSIRWKIVQRTYQGYHQMQWIVLCTLHRYWPKKKNCCPIKRPSTIFTWYWCFYCCILYQKTIIIFILSLINQHTQFYVKGVWFLCGIFRLFFHSFLIIKQYLEKKYLAKYLILNIAKLQLFDKRHISIP